MLCWDTKINIVYSRQTSLLNRRDCFPMCLKTINKSRGSVRNALRNFFYKDRATAQDTKEKLNKMSELREDHNRLLESETKE